jgi:arabinogalactan endo-1,4-beta-galactosidase
MKVSEAFPSKYLKASDLQGRKVKVTISHVEFEDIGQGADKNRKPVLYFVGKEKGVVMNKTNANNIAMMYGDETDDWQGVEVELFEAMVDFQGQSKPAIRVRPLPPTRKQPAPAEAGPPAGHPASMDSDVPF